MNPHEEMDTNDPLQHLAMPDPMLDPAKQPLRIALLQSKHTAAVGLWLILVPSFFLAAIIMKYFFHAGIGLVTVFEDSIAEMDRASSTHWITPILFLALPLLAIVLNLLSIVHVEHVRARAQLVLTVKLHWINIALAFIGASVIGIFLLHAYAEAAHQ